MDQHLPTGWDNQRIQQLIKSYESSTEEELLLEDELTAGSQENTTVTVPTELLPEIRRLLAIHKTA